MMPGRKPKGEIMSPAQMIEAGMQKRTSRLYKVEAMQVTDEAISQTVAKACSEMANAANNGKIDLSNIDLVKTVSLEYSRACAQTATFPSMAGLARAMGCNRSTLYAWMNRRADTETGQWLQMCHDLYSDVLAEASLRNNCNPIVGIFLQKAIYGLRDNVAVEINHTSEEDLDRYASDDWKKKYLNMISD